MKTIIIYIEVLYSKFLNLLNIKKDVSVIPIGQYCYEIDYERNEKEPTTGYWIKRCRYYRHMDKGDAACTFVGFVGFDLCLHDQCKICGEKDEINEDDLS